MLADFIRAQVVDVGFALADQLQGKFVKLVEIIRGVELAFFPVKSQPVDVFFDRIDVFDIFFDRVGVVEAQVALAAEFTGDAEIDGDRFSMTDVQIAIRLGWEAGCDMAETG